MATGIEIRTTQKGALYDLLKAKAGIKNDKDSESYKALEELIIKTKTLMEAEDVAYVEKMIAQLP